MSKIEVNTVAPQCGTTLTLGESGDTVQLGTGASQSGFGRTGTVNWQTTVKTSTFTAVNGEGYFVDTTSGAFTVNLPAGTSGSIVAFKDYADTFDTANLIISANGSQKIQNSTEDYIVGTESESLTLVYADDTKGWLVVNDGNKDAGTVGGFITATGGTITTVCTNFKVHTFTGPGTFSVTSGAGPTAVADYLVIAGGGGGGQNDYPAVRGAGGGGAGGSRESGGTSSGCYAVSPLGSSPSSVAGISITPGCYPITVGGGGAAGPTSLPSYPSPDPSKTAVSGSSSIFSSITSAGGGYGASHGQPTGASGGSGGGGYNNEPGGAGNTPPVAPPQGQDGGTGSPNPSSPPWSGGGGGGATASGTAGTAPQAGPGGAGATSSINATPTARAGGGGGGGGGSGGTGGSGGGGAGSTSPSAATAGTTNTGGGGGGSGIRGASGGAGGSGIVIIRYRFQ